MKSPPVPGIFQVLHSHAALSQLVVPHYLAHLSTGARVVGPFEATWGRLRGGVAAALRELTGAPQWQGAPGKQCRVGTDMHEAAAVSRPPLCAPPSSLRVLVFKVRVARPSACC